jgi:hypothetical protein
VFSTCIHCNADLGRNEAFEVFPVGTRLAFDPAKGRLWVVCRRCERWNLSPLDERWEAIELAERRYRDSRLRVSTDNIGLARLREGLDLIRIGEPQRPEMAAWRYGDQFGRRRKRQLLLSGAAVGGAAAFAGGILWAGIGAGMFGVWGANGLDSLINGRPRAIVGKIPLPDGRLVAVQRRHARMSVIERASESDGLSLRLESVEGTHQLRGDDAMRAAARLLPTVNRFGGSKRQVGDAVDLLEAAGDPRRALLDVQRQIGALDSDTRWRRTKMGWWDADVESIKKIPGALHALEPRFRLALEMALHEESERRAMDGELTQLAAAWRQAEEIAQIADTLLVTPAIESKLDDLRRRGGDSGTT